MQLSLLHVPTKGNPTLEDVQDASVSDRSGARGGDLIMPAPINAHDHGYGIRTLDFAAFDDALEVWIPWLRLRPRTDPYLEALVAFSRLALNGVGGTMHCHNSLNTESLITEAALVCKAASDVGIRLALSCPMLDFDPWAYGGGPPRLRPFMSVDEWGAVEDTIPRYASIARQLEAVDIVAAENKGGFLISSMDRSGRSGVRMPCLKPSQMHLQTITAVCTCTCWKAHGNAPGSTAGFRMASSDISMISAFCLRGLPSRMACN